ncbi:MAG TPA: hydrogen peroxide-inducible genes activator [Thiothrix sp.]|nr:hydrogen peroxide-inducible genes activator [Thiothrix sp.]
MTNLPTLKQLRYFIALERYAHFGRAAEACFVSQSAFSVAIRELENTLGVQLVDRTNKQVTVTRIGRDVATHARHCLRDVEYLSEIVQSSQQPLSGRLTLGVIPTIAPFLLPNILPNLRQQFPELKLFLREDTTQQVHQQLLNGDLDLIIIALPYALSHVEMMPLFKDRFCLACHAQTQWLDPQQFHINKIERLPRESILLLEDGHCLRDHALSACNIRHRDTIHQFNASSLLSLIEMINADLGITFLTEMAKHSQFLEKTAIKLYPLQDNSYREIGLAWRKGSAREQEFKLLGTLLQKFSR